MERPAQPNNPRALRTPDAPDVTRPEESIHERIAGFRRRTNLRRGAEEENNLAFDFAPDARSSSSRQGWQDIETAFQEAPAHKTPVNLESISLISQPGKLAPSEEEDFAGSLRGARTNAPRNIEFPRSDLPAESRFEDADLLEPLGAPLRPRFFADLIDALLLVALAALFTAVFAAAGGRLQKSPEDLGIAAFIAAFWFFVYFAAFSVMTRRTPGQAAMGLEIRNLDGEPPSRVEALLRAFGYLISLSAFMLGFLWAVFDSDGMAWQDHVSGTVLTVAPRSATKEAQ